MKTIYKLPKWCAVIVFGIIVYIIYCEIRVARATNVFEIIQYGEIINNLEFTVLGVDSYTFFLVLGVVAGIIVSVLRRQIIYANISKALLISVLFIIQAFVGIKLFFGMEKVIAHESWDYFSISGFSLYGAIFFSMMFIPVIAKLFKVDAKLLFDYLICTGLVVLVCVKFGCFTVGCCAARACSITEIDIILPIQLFEALWLLFILQIMFNIEAKRLKVKDRNYRIGANFFVTVILYGVFRFCIEFIKDAPELFLGITINQLYALTSIIISIIVLKSRTPDS